MNAKTMTANLISCLAAFSAGSIPRTIRLVYLCVKCIILNLFAFFRIPYRDFDVFPLLTRSLSLRRCVRQPEQKTCVKYKPAEPIESLGKAPPDRPPPTSQHLRCSVLREL